MPVSSRRRAGPRRPTYPNRQSPQAARAPVVPCSSVSPRPWCSAGSVSPWPFPPAGRTTRGGVARRRHPEVAAGRSGRARRRPCRPRPVRRPRTARTRARGRTRTGRARERGLPPRPPPRRHPAQGPAPAPAPAAPGGTTPPPPPPHRGHRAVRLGKPLLPALLERSAAGTGRAAAAGAGRARLGGGERGRAVGEQFLKLTVQGKGQETVVVKRLTVRMAGKRAPLAWNDYAMGYPGVGCGGGVPTRFFTVALDAARPGSCPRRGTRTSPSR